MKKLSIIIFILTLITSCYKEDYFGQSNYKKIIQISFDNQMGSTIIDETNRLIFVSVPLNMDIINISPKSIVISNFSHIYPTPDMKLDFSVPILYTVTAEDGSKAIYTVTLTKSQPNIQLENSTFDAWYQSTSSNKTYDQPGTGATNTIWATGNEGTVTLGNPTTKKELISGTDYCAVMTTLDLGVLANITGQRMGAGTLFTGVFDLNLANPISSAKFGIPYTGKPTHFSIDYTYVPGTPYKNGKNLILPGSDSCDIYVLLENRDGTAVKRIATAWFRSQDVVSAWTTLTQSFVYGDVGSDAPYYMQLPAGYIWGTASDAVTHISVVCSSSARGNLYEGGVNSTLKVNNFKLIY